MYRHASTIRHAVRIQIAFSGWRGIMQTDPSARSLMGHEIDGPRDIYKSEIAFSKFGGPFVLN